MPRGIEHEPFNNLRKKCGPGRCVYSKSMDQVYPRKCIVCGIPETPAVSSLPIIDKMQKEIARLQRIADSSTHMDEIHEALCKKSQIQAALDIVIKIDEA